MGYKLEVGRVRLANRGFYQMGLDARFHNLLWLATFAATSLLSCSGAKPPAENGTCRSACANLQALGCDGYLGSPGYDEEYATEDDLTCVNVCLDISNDPAGELYLDCTTSAQSCRAVDRCFEMGDTDHE